MATKDNSSGLLSKVVRFVRNPTKDWSELNLPEPEPEPEHESGYSKLALKDLIQRKRQNDFVRRREFDHLRKLRRNGPSFDPDLVGRPSFFQTSSISNLDDRAQTIKKIDEIEAQMSKQWWKGKKDGAAPPEATFAAAARVPAGGDDSSQMSVSSPESLGSFAITLRSESIPGPDSMQSIEGDPAQARPITAKDDLPGERARPVRTAKGPRGKMGDAVLSKFSTSKLFSVKLGDSLADPDLEEAAIRFANGDDAGAEATLLTALQADNVNPDSADSWAAALFDLYRSTGQQASFDRVAIEFAQRFGHSAPAWFSTPDLLGISSGASPLSGATQPAQSDQINWICPAQLDLPEVQALIASLTPTTQAWRLNWSRLESITVAAAQALAGLFARWCREPVRLHFDGADGLGKSLRSSTPSGDKQVDLFWWRLRLDALRIMRLQDEFELAALDFCVTYEVSPPAWEEVRCEYVQSSTSSFAPLQDSYGSFDDSASTGPVDFSQAATVPMELNATANVVELTGEVLGDAVEALDKLQAGYKGANRLVISCARLIRVDFSAAGSILNWVAARQAEGCHVQFRNVPRLVAAFFNVIGINEHARVDLRTS
jgi:ABC-type transporter Mla MlaB component